MAHEGNFLTGIAAIIPSTVLFGFMLLPVRRYAIGDGIYVQFMMGIGILIVGFTVYILEGFPVVYPLAMLGGFFWAAGNTMAVTAINVLGLGLAVLVWSTTACISGWATSRFGLFGVSAAPPKSDFLNYAGLIFVIIGGIIYTFVKSTSVETQMKARSEISKSSRLAMNTLSRLDVDLKKESGETNGSPNASALSQKNPRLRKAIGIALAVCAGTLFGQMCTPVLYIQDHPSNFGGASSRGLVYVFSHFIGITLSTSTIFLIYALCRNNKPWLRAELAAPSTVSGVMWASGMTLLFVSNEHLSQTITFPLITAVPGCITSLISVFYFKEIEGQKNLTVLSIAFVQTILGAMLVAASKEISL